MLKNLFKSEGYFIWTESSRYQVWAKQGASFIIIIRDSSAAADISIFLGISRSDILRVSSETSELISSEFPRKLPSRYPQSFPGNCRSDILRVSSETAELISSEFPRKLPSWYPQSLLGNSLADILRVSSVTPELMSSVVKSWSLTNCDFVKTSDL